MSVSPSGSVEPVPLKLTVQRQRRRSWASRRVGGRGVVARERVNPLDRAAVEVGVEEVAAGADLEVHRPAGVVTNGCRVAGFGIPLASGNMTQMQLRE